MTERSAPPTTRVAALLATLCLLATMCSAPRGGGPDPAETGPDPTETGGDPTEVGDAPGDRGAARSAEQGSEPAVVTVAVDRAAPAPDAPVEEAVAGLLAFTRDLQAAVAAEPANTVFSPLSIALAFGMARAGAAGRTGEEIDEVLGFPPRVHAAFNVLEQTLVTGDGPPPPTDPGEERDAAEGPRPPVFSIANALYAQHGLPLEVPFLATLAADYGAGMHVVDFADTDATKEAIDAWVQRHTAGRIEELFAEVQPNWLLVLANAVYLKADWEVPFADAVQDEPFTLASGEQITVPTMRRVDHMQHAAGAGWQAVALPYAESDLVMVVLVADERGTDPGALLAPDVLGDVRAGLGQTVVDLQVPQWDFDTDIDLVATLRDLGMSAPFADADFSGISRDAGLFIGEAVHRATITVDEWGTEAAAVTGIGFPSAGPPEPEAVVHADRPFAFAIVHLPTGAPLFAGTVADPSSGS